MKANKRLFLNMRSEIVSKCPHKSKIILYEQHKPSEEDNKHSTIVTSHLIYYNDTVEFIISQLPDDPINA